MHDFGAIEGAPTRAVDDTRGENAGEVQPSSQLHMDLVAEMKPRLRMQCERRYYGVIDTLQFNFKSTRAVVQYRSEQDRQVVERLRLMLRSAAQLVGVSVNILVGLNSRS